MPTLRASAGTSIADLSSRRSWLIARAIALACVSRGERGDQVGLVVRGGAGGGRR